MAQLTATIEEHLALDTDATLASMQLQLDPANHAARQTHAAIICVFATRAMGMEVLRVPTPRTAEPFIRGLAGLVRRALGGPA